MTATGIHLWNEAKQLIPGGNQLLSKRAEMFLPERWPTYYQRAKGIEVWDMDGKCYRDMSLMGVGTCVLGYAHEAVNAAVKKAIDQGNMCTLNCPEEVELAKELVALHPWAQMVRFARSGGEACTIAVRIARAASGKDKLAFCGYHGWHDWYISSNLEDGRHLDHQMFPNLRPLGIPQALKGTAFPFHYGKLDELERIFADNAGEIGAIIMEVQRQKDLDAEFVRGARRLADKAKAVLIFDEVTSGFRSRAGGMHVLYGLEPDVVVLGKAMGNGYPIAAVVGKRNVMDAAQETFISSTYWTERTGFAAALAVLEEFKRRPVAQHLTQAGKQVTDGWNAILKEGNLPITIGGLPSIPAMQITGKDAMLIKTALTQEMLKKGYLASSAVYLSCAHTPAVIEEYLKDLKAVVQEIAAALRAQKLNDLLEGPVCHSGFNRLA